VTSYYGSNLTALQQPPFQGNYFIKTTDTTSADNGGTIIVDAAGNRWYLQLSNNLYATQFGADPTGTQDSTSKIQNAINWLSSQNGGILLFPEGTFKHTGISLLNSVSLEGVGAGGAPNAAIYLGTVLLNTSNTNSITIGNGSINMRNIRIRNLRITSTGTALSGINATQWGNMDALTGVMIDTHITGGVTLLQCWDLSVSDCWIMSNTNYGMLAGNSSNNIRIEKTMFFQNGTDGLQISGVFNCLVDKCDFESNYNNQIHLIVGSNRGINITGSYFEGLQNSSSGYYGIKLDANVCDTAKIEGNFADLSNASSSSPVCFLDVESGNSRVAIKDLSFVNNSTPQYASFVNFKSGANLCNAYLALTTNPCINSASNCRIYYEPYNETGVLSGNSSTQTFTANTYQQILFPNVQQDTKSEWNASTSTFIPRDYGLYEITYSASVAMTAGDNFTVRLFDNTGNYEYSRILLQGATTGTTSLNGSFVELLNPSNTIQIQVNPSAARSTNPGGYNYSFVRIHRLS